jgi:hypothetical protein
MNPNDPVIQGVTEGPNVVGSTPTVTPPPLPPFEGGTFFQDSAPVPSEMDTFAAEDRQKALDPGFLGSIGLSVKSDWAASWALRQAGRLGPGGPPPTEAQRKDWLDTVPQAYWDLMDGSESAAQLEQRKQWAMEDAAREQRLAAAGWAGWTARLLTNLFDPTAVGVSLATEGLAAPYIGGLKLGRLGRIVASGLTAGASNLAIDAATSVVNPKIDARTMAESFGMGLIWGGAVGSLRSHPSTTEEANRLIQIGKQQIADARGPSSAGAAEVARPTNPLVENAPIIDGPVPQAAFTSVRKDAVGQLGASQSKSAKLYGPHLAEESVGFTDHSTVPNSASEVGSRLHRAAVADWFQSVKPAWNVWAKDNGVGFLQRRFPGRDYKRFMNDVSNYVEDRSPQGYHPSTVQVGDKFRKLMGQWAELGNNPGADEGLVRRAVSGFENIGKDAHYVPKYSDPDKINSLSQRFATRTLQNFVKKAVLSAVSDMKPEIADRIASGWLKRIRGAQYGIQDDFSRAFNTSNAETIRTTLRDLQIDDVDIEQIIKSVGKSDTAGDSTRTMRRSPLNYTYSDMAPDMTGNMQRLNMRDFFVSDADQLMHRYSREMSGRVALAKTQIRNPDNGELIVDGITSDSEYKKLIDHIRQDYANLGSPGKHDSALKADVANMEYLQRAILGHAQHSGENYVPWLRRLREANAARLMSNLGLNQAQEVGMIVTQLGLKAMIAQMPSLRRIINGVGDSVLNSRLAQELEAGTGLGTDHFFGQARFHHLEDMVGEHGTGRAGHAIDNALQVSKGITSNVSLMRHVNSYLQQWTSRTIAQRYADMAFGRGLKGIGGKNVERIRALGLDDATAERIFDQIKAHAEVSGSRRKLDALNLEKWEPQLRSRFLNAVYRQARQIVMENDAGNLHRWMSQPMGQMLMQFRTFIFGAWAKRTLANLHHLDMQAFSTLMVETMLGAATYAVNVHAKAFSREDPEAYKAQELAFPRLVAAGFGRSGISSILPTIVDTATTFTMGKPLFDTRTSGTPNDLILGIPALDWFNSVTSAAQGIIGSTLDNRQMSQHEIQSTMRTLPWGNWLPLITLMGALNHDRPYFEPHNSPDRRPLANQLFYSK